MAPIRAFGGTTWPNSCGIYARSERLSRDHLVVFLAKSLCRPAIRKQSRTTQSELLTSVNRALLDEAERVFPGILSVERPFAPRPDDNSSARRIVDVLGKEAPQSFSALEGPFQVPHGEVEGFRRRVRLPHRRDVEH